MSKTSHPRKLALTPAQVEEAKQLKLNGLSYKKIAPILGCDHMVVRKAVLGLGGYAHTRTTADGLTRKVTWSRPGRKFTMAEARKIRDRFAEGGWTIDALAGMHECSPGHMRHLLGCTGPYVGDPYPVLGLPGTPKAVKGNEHNVGLVRQMRERDIPVVQIAAKVGLSTTTVYDIINKTGRYADQQGRLDDRVVRAPEPDAPSYSTAQARGAVGRDPDASIGKLFDKLGDMLIDSEVGTLQQLCQGRRVASPYVQAQLDFVIQRKIPFDSDLTCPQAVELRSNIMDYLAGDIPSVTDKN